MNVVRVVRHFARRWGQLHSLRRYFARQPLVSRPCPLCGSNEARLLVRGDRDFIGIRTSQCARCGFIFSSPYYPAEVISSFYTEGYRSLFKGQPDPAGLAVRQRYLRDRSAFFLRFFEEQGILPLPCGSILDVGCGEGTILRSLQHRFPGLRLTGVEPTVSFAKHLAADTGIPVVDRIGQVGNGARFDLAISIHVLEHVHDPVALLREIRERLGRGGRLYLDVPDLAAYQSITDLHLAHCNHFSAHTLRAALERAGLVPERVVRHRPPTLPPSVFAVARSAEPAELEGVALLPDPEAAQHARRVAQIDTGRVSLWTRQVKEGIAGRLRARRVAAP
jgi:2-polyprenyl-3-methyl-5-hydroxy-6-metoxy-1,4-benzoquinol methylase